MLRLFGCFVFMFSFQFIRNSNDFQNSNLLGRVFLKSELMSEVAAGGNAGRFTRYFSFASVHPRLELPAFPPG